MIRIVLLMVLCGLTFSVQAQKKSSKEYEATSLYYFLPKASFVIKVEMNCIQYIPGVFCKQAKEYLGFVPDIMEYAEKWEIKNIDIIPEYLPDEQACFEYPLHGSYSAAQLSLTPTNILVGVGTDQTVDSENKTVSFELVKTSEKTIDYRKSNIYNPLVETLDSNFTTIVIDGESKKVWDPIVRYEPKTLEDLLNETVKAIYRLRADKQKILSQESELSDGKSIEVMLAALDKSEKEYMELFVGKSKQQTVIREFMCTPEKENVAQEIFRFSEQEGITEKASVSYSLIAQNALVAATSDSLSTNTSIKYRIPAFVDMHLMCDDQKLNSFKAIVPQLGVIKQIPLEAIVNELLILELHPQYGSLKYMGKKE